jgi:2-hydroxy-6-oxonona-2,4-dienedioate hydrolase
MNAYTSVWQDVGSGALTQGWVEVAEIRTRYWRAAGDASRVPLVLLHGTGGHVEAFARNIGAFGEERDVWALDLVGHGWSSMSSGPLEIADYVDHVLAFLDEMRIEQAVFAGVSLGGWIASRLAIDHPERVAAIVLATPGGSRANAAVMATIKAKTSVAATEPTWSSVRARLEYLVHDPARISDDLVATRLAIYRRPGAMVNMANVLVLQDPEVRGRNLIDDSEFGSIRCPTLIIWTEHDPTAPVSEGQRVAALVPGSEFVVFDDAGHWPQFEKASLFNTTVVEFVARALDASSVRVDAGVIA